MWRSTDEGIERPRPARHQSIAGLRSTAGFDLTRDWRSLAHARILKAILDQTVQILEAQGDLPDAVPAAAAPKTVANPFN